MKYVIVLMQALLISMTCYAEKSGDLDKSFGSDPQAADHWFGWVGFNSSGRESYIFDSVLDSQGRILDLEVFRAAGSTTDYQVSVTRYLSDGNIDNSFSLNAGVIDKTLVNNGFKMGLAINDTDGVFVARSEITCEPGNTMCQKDISLSHYDSNGQLSGSRVIAFDLGATFDRKDDVFKDMVYLKELKKLILVAEVERTNTEDTDFGIAVMDVNEFGGLIFSDFSGDATDICYFDHNNPAGSKDSTISVVYRKQAPYHVIVGGSAFEGNGINNDGWNLAFCQFDVNGVGSLVNKWSTQPLADVDDDRELMQDMVLSTASTPSLMVTAQVPTGMSMDFAVVQYEWDSIGGSWIFNDQYGLVPITGRSGFSTYGFNLLFIGETLDVPTQIVVEDDGSVIVAGNSYWTDNSVNHSQVNLVKFNPLGLLDLQWGNAGTASHNFSSINDQMTAMVQDKNKKELYVAGNHTIDGNTGDFLANIINNPDIIFTNGFEKTRIL